VEHADTELAVTLWLTGPEVSFIHPRGHERGWEDHLRPRPASGVAGVADARIHCSQGGYPV